MAEFLIAGLLLLNDAAYDEYQIKGYRSLKGLFCVRETTLPQLPGNMKEEIEKRSVSKMGVFQVTENNP